MAKRADAKKVYCYCFAPNIVTLHQLKRMHNFVVLESESKYADAFVHNVVHGGLPLCVQLVTFDNGVVTAPVKENTGRRLRTAVDLISLRVGKSRWGLRWEGKG